MTTQKTKSAGRGAGPERPPAGAPEEVVDRLAGLLPADELERALEGLEPEQVTGPGGLVSQLAGRVDRNGARRRADRASRLPGRGGAAGRGGQYPQRLDSEDPQDRARAGRDQDPA
jgi:hypothetical protein